MFCLWTHWNTEWLLSPLQMEEYGMMTPPTLPLPPLTIDMDHEARMRSSPFPHYDPEQHPWAPSPPSQVRSVLCCIPCSME